MRSVETTHYGQPARALANLYRRCAPGGGCPYDISTMISVLRGLRLDRAVHLTELGEALGLSASTVYGCVIELEDHGLARPLYRTQEAPLCAGSVRAEMTAVGWRLLRETTGRRPRGGLQDGENRRKSSADPGDALR